MPDKLMMKGMVSDDSTDSGVNSKLENSPSDNETEPGACGEFFFSNIKKKIHFLFNVGSGAKRRFTSYLSFDK
jgi:hypothetical protein